MGIKGITDRVSAGVKPDIRIWKGDVKGDRSAGKTLQDKFRLDIKNITAKKHLINAYKEKGLLVQESGEFVIVDHLNIFFAYDDSERSFNTKMTGYEDGKLTRVCDRQEIYQEREKYSDGTGIRYHMVDCQKPCEADQEKPFSACPFGCNRSGTLYFYLWELLDLGVYQLCSIETSSWEDIISLTPKLESIEEQFGSLRNPGIVVGNYYNYIPVILTRANVKISRPILTGKAEGYKRTGEKAKGDTWALSIAINPQWMQIYNSQRALNTANQLGYRPNPKLIEQVYGDVIETQAITSPPINVLPDFKTRLSEVYRNNGWDKKSWELMMAENFGTTEVDKVEQDLLLAIASSVETLEKYQEF